MKCACIWPGCHEEFCILDYTYRGSNYIQKYLIGEKTFRYQRVSPVYHTSMLEAKHSLDIRFIPKKCIV